MEDLMKRIIACGICSLALVGAVPLHTPALINAQELRTQTQSVGSSEVSDKELQSFAGAYVEYQRIRHAYEPRLSKVKDANEREKIQREGNLKVKNVLAQQGLTPQTYNRLFTAVNSDARLRHKALELIDEARRRS
jgi:hypothetical protein